MVLSHARTGDYILDFGAGIGTFAQRISESGYTINCLEPDPKQAREIATLGLTVYSDLNQVDNDSQDYIYTLNVLEHIEDENAILRDLYNKLKPGGRLLIYVPAFQILYSSMDRKVGHYRRYTRRSLSEAVRGAGFKVGKAHYVDSIGYLVTLIYKMVGDNSGDVNMRALRIYDRFLFPLNRIFDKVMGSFIGKNIFLIAKK
jgi:SAM-dependent methyltransferase